MPSRLARQELNLTWKKSFSRSERMLHEETNKKKSKLLIHYNCDCEVKVYKHESKVIINNIKPIKFWSEKEN